MQTKELTLLPEEAFNEESFHATLYQKLGLKQDGDYYVKPIKRSIDARAKKVIVRVVCEIIPVKEKQPLIRYSKDSGT